MFNSSQEAHYAEPAYLKKKKEFSVAIRQQQRNKIKNRLRVKAQLPQDKYRQLQTIPSNIKGLLQYAHDEEVNAPTQIVILEHIAGQLATEPNSVLNSGCLEPEEMIAMMHRIVTSLSDIASFFEHCFIMLIRLSKFWDPEVRAKLLPLLYKAYQRGVGNTKHIIPLLNSLPPNNFYYDQLKFIHLMLRKHPTIIEQTGWLHEGRISLMTQQLVSVQYSQKERLKMAEILNQLQYIEWPRINIILNVPSFYGDLQYILGLVKSNKLMIEKCLFIIHNILIDEGSKCFENQMCFCVMYREMQCKDNPFKLRIIMAEIFLSVYFFYPRQEIVEYLNRTKQGFIKTITFVIQTFSISEEIIDLCLDCLFEMLLMEKTSESDALLRTVKGHSDLPQIIRNYPKGQEILDEVFNQDQ